MEHHMSNTANIRTQLADLLKNKKFTTVGRESAMTDLVGNSTIEIVSASFIADEDSIFGEVNWDYVRREEEWYNSQSLNVNDIPGGAPAVWKAVADKTTGEINSNYGWCIYSPENGFNATEHGELECQYTRAFAELKQNPESRRAIMIYTRPSMWLDYNKGGRSDFMCTNAVQYMIRDGALHAVVQMRSNDAIFGYKNDRAWQQHVLENLAVDLSIPPGNLYWNVGSLHIYSRHYYLVDHFVKTGETNIAKDRYKELYPLSEYAV
jgi:thymidylate synthase